MKINENYILKKIAGSPVVVPVGEAVKNINGMITLNEPAETIWKCLEEGKTSAEILEVLKREYNAPEDVLSRDLESFIEKLRSFGILED